MTREALPLLRATHGLVVNVASIAGTVPTPDLGVYGASKAALIALTRTLSREEESTGVRATALCPAFVDTPMAEWAGLEPEAMIQPEDCAELVRALLRLSPAVRVPVIVVERSGDASRWSIAGPGVSGQVRPSRPRRCRAGPTGLPPP